MRTTQSTRTATAFPRAATVRISTLATAFLTGTAAISLLVAPAAGATTLSASTTSGTQQSVATTWGHDDSSRTEKTVTWLMPDAPSGNIWPQKLVAGVPDCGTDWYQVDVYRYGTAAEKKIVDAFMKDGILEGPAKGSTSAEDHAAIIRWSFQQPANTKPECTATPTPTPTPSVPVTPPTGPSTGEVPVTPPVVTPPVVTPPVVTPPVVTPPVVTPPVVTPPVVTPPVVTPNPTPTPVETIKPVDTTKPVETPTPTPTPTNLPVGKAETPVVTPVVSGVDGAARVTPTPTVVPPVSATPVKPVAVASDGNQLAVTGAKVGMLSALAAAFVAAGIVAFRISRRAQSSK